MRRSRPLLLSVVAAFLVAPLAARRDAFIAKVDRRVDDAAALAKSAARGARRAVSTAKLDVADGLVGATVFDAMFAGAASGYLCGKLLVGDPTWLALAGCMSFGFAKEFPECKWLPPRFVRTSRRAAGAVARLRAQHAKEF